MLLDRLIFKPRGDRFDLERVHRRSSSLSGALPDPLIDDVVLLIAPGKRARAAVLAEREREPERMPWVGIVELGSDRIVLHQNTRGPGFEACQAFLEWMARKLRARIYDDLGRRVELVGQTLVRRKPATKISAADAELTAAGPAEARLLAHLSEPAGLEFDAGEFVQMFAPIQRSRLWQYDDGTVVRFYPKGSLQIPGATHQVGVVTKGADRFRGPESIAFLIDHEARPVPRHLMQLNSPYPPDELQDLVFKRLAMEAGTRRVQDGLPSTRPASEG